MGRVQFRGILRVGDAGSLSLERLAEGGSPLTIPGVKVVAIRGHDADDDEWEIILRCDNPVDASGRRLLPINYQIDKDTAVLIFN